MNYFDEDVLNAVLDGKGLPPSGYKLNADKTDFEPKTEEEILAGDLTVLEDVCEIADYCNSQIAQAEQYLTETDYVIAKINEAKIEDDDELEAELKAKYADELAQRKVARKTVNRLEEVLATLPSIDDLVAERVTEPDAEDYTISVEDVGEDLSNLGYN